MTRHSRGMTLVELMVAVGIMVIMIAGVGFVFSKSANAVRGAQAVIDTNANIRAGLARLREDLQSLTQDGFLCIIEAKDNAPTVLAFTTSGKYVTKDGHAANAAIVVYMLALEKDNETSGEYLFARYAYPLVSITNPANLDHFEGAATPADLVVNDRFCRFDWIGQSLAGVRASMLPPAPADFEQLYIDPLWDKGYSRLNTAPLTINYDASTGGGVEELWPYMFGGCTEMHVDFFDGKYPGGGAFTYGSSTPGETPWVVLDEDHPDTASFSDLNTRSDATSDAVTVRNNPRRIIWDYRNKSAWPEALRLRLKLKDVAGRLEEPREYEAILPLPRND